jgi:hypothetical protein
MAGNGVRKNKDWYDDDEVLNFVSNLLVKYSPATHKDVITAFKEFIDKFEKLELIWYEWETIYKAGRSPEEITKDILYPSRTNDSIIFPESLEPKRQRPYSRKNGRNHKAHLRTH